MVQLLLDAGAQLLHKDEDGTALDNAMKQKRCVPYLTVCQDAESARAACQSAYADPSSSSAAPRRYDCVELLDAAMEKRGMLEAIEKSKLEGGEGGEDEEDDYSEDEHQGGEEAADSAEAAEDVAQSL